MIAKRVLQGEGGGIERPVLNERLTNGICTERN